MKASLAAQLALCGMILCAPAAGQRTYTFEEACRLAGNTTGACAPKSQQKAVSKCIPLQGKAFHAEKANKDCVDAVVSPVIDSEIFVEMIGIPNITKINDLKLTMFRSTGLGNAFARYENGERSIIIDPVWAKAVTAEAYLVLGHEAGHHFCGHTLESSQANPREQELEADRFSGAAIKRFEVYHGKPFLAEALKAAERLYAEARSRGYPARAARLEAIMLGYNSGSPCGNLAPAIRGYSPNPR